MRTRIRRPGLLLALVVLWAPAAGADPGAPVRDCPDCPAMVRVPVGTFVMGTPTADPRDPASRAEAPAVIVRIAKAFALGRTEVTRRDASVVLRATRVAAPWSEMGVTWNNQPATGDRYADAAVGTGTGWFTWDVTAIAQAWQTGPNYGLLLEVAPPAQTAYANRAFLSRQGEAPPRLVVT